jgi:hypothetical protein
MRSGPVLPMLSDRELAKRILERAREGKLVRLTPETAVRVAHALRVLATKPRHAAITQIICQQGCKIHCYSCKGTANAIMALMAGDNPEPRKPPEVVPLTKRQEMRIVRMKRG